MSQRTEQEPLHKELEKLIEDTMMLLKTVEVKREEISEGVTAEIEQLTSLTKSLKQENVSLQSLPKKLAVKVQELLPDIATQLDRINEKKYQDYIKNINAATQEYNCSVKEIVSEFKHLKQSFDRSDQSRIKRYFLGLGIVVTISVLASLGATYLMIKMFPQHVHIQSPSNITVQESKVSLWSSRNVNISGDVKQQRRGR